jgi:hypothetical protein
VIDFLGARREKNHRSFRMTAQGAADIESAHVRQANIQDYQRIIPRPRPFHRFPPQCAAIRGAAFRGKRVGQRIGNRRFVIDNQYFHCR